eukprot:TRINITY_DN46861_c0_g1_i1.p1 TRINITY_DN46861_c0_g1~~TRINITY_DN46861_c0_g1_i1.p1  ORF type:complete len:577 (+),score=183.29 TRINITY_DN46861_c0_g1_i1:99-1733(+)
MGGDGRPVRQPVAQYVYEPSAPPAPPGFVWSEGAEPLFGVADADRGPDLPEIGTEVTLRGMVSGHRPDGTVLVEVVGGSGSTRIPIKPQQLTVRSQLVERLSRGGVEYLRLPPAPPERVAASGSCCDTSAWRRSSRYVAAGRIVLYGFLCVLTWAAAVTLFMLSICLLPFFIGLPIFKHSAIVWRWMAHRHLDILLSIAPVPQGIMLMHPSARIPDGTFCDYFKSGHTWSCIFYLMLVSFPLGFTAFCLVMTLLPTALCLMVIVIGLPLLVATLNTVRCLGVTMRGTAVCFLAEVVRDEGAVPLLGSPAVRPGSASSSLRAVNGPASSGGGSPAAPSPVRGSPEAPQAPAAPAPPAERSVSAAAPGAAAAAPPTPPEDPIKPCKEPWEFDEEQLKWVPDAAEVIEVFAESSFAPAPDDKTGQGQPVAGAAAAAGSADGARRQESAWLICRERTPEEESALVRFRAAWGKLFTAPCRLQDVVIAPPREVGMGPRHFIRIADQVADEGRLKLIKTYRQLYSAMYVHIVDSEEQRQHYGPDFSAAYS